MALCEVDYLALQQQTEAFMQTPTPAERKKFVPLYGSYMQMVLGDVLAENHRRCITSGSWMRITAEGELSIVRQVITDPKTGLPIIDLNTQLPVGHITSLTHRWTDKSQLSLLIIQEVRNPFLSPIVTLNQIQAMRSKRTITFNPLSDQS